MLDCEREQIVSFVDNCHSDNCKKLTAYLYNILYELLVHHVVQLSHYIIISLNKMLK